MDARIRPAPTADERRALLAALAEARNGAPPAYASEWRRAALAPAADYEATGRPPSRRGATRA